MHVTQRTSRAVRLAGLVLLALSSAAGASAPKADFWARYQRRLKPGEWAKAESASPHCSSQCVELTGDELGALRASFERHHFRQITTHPIDVSPHRNGVCLTEGRGEQSRELCDIDREPDPQWAADWAALCREVEEVFARAQGAGQRQRAR